MLDDLSEARQRLDEVRDEIRKLAEILPEDRDYRLWRRLVEEERKLMELLAEEPDSQDEDTGQDGWELRS